MQVAELDGGPSAGQVHHLLSGEAAPGGEENAVPVREPAGGRAQGQEGRRGGRRKDPGTGIRKVRQGYVWHDMYHDMWFVLIF